MQTLEKGLRNKLEKTVKEARDVSETAARAALGQLGVGEAEPFKHLTESEKNLRRKLRIHGRQLGDTLNGRKVQTIDRLVEETAYEHWHRMLFARFLAENNLLMYPDPDSPIAVSLEECEDLAAEEGARNGWELAARFAARMLPQIFRPDSPIFQLVLPPEHEQRLEQLVAELPPEVFTASDSLGWVYQFWQAKRKDEVNASEVKIGARELPAVTQLFTEPYMVAFLLDNSLGAWWAARSDAETRGIGATRRRGEKGIFQTAQSEEEVRQACALPGVPLRYLRFVNTDDGSWTPAAGTFPGWPDDLKEFKVLDPCCGSGHFLVAAFLMIVPMRMEMEGLSAQEAVDAVLKDNLHGLEIDQRCVELAVFALALAAWRYPEAGGYRPLPGLHLACSGLSVSIKKDEWLNLAGSDSLLRQGLDGLYEQFGNATSLGSLIDPSVDLVKAPIFAPGWQKISDLLATILSEEREDQNNEIAVTAQGLSKAASILQHRYDWVITNVPYLAAVNQDTPLKSFSKIHYPKEKNDLSTVFMARCIRLVSERGHAALVVKQDWLYKAYYKKARKNWLTAITWRLVALLGSRAFETITGEEVKVILILLDGNGPPTGHNACFLDVANELTAPKKSTRLISFDPIIRPQAAFLSAPDYMISIDSGNHDSLLSGACLYQQGICTGDYNRFGRLFWEVDTCKEEWIFQQSTVNRDSLFGGMEHVLLWADKERTLSGFVAERIGDERVGSWLRGNLAWGRRGIAVSSTGDLTVSLYLGNLYDDSTMALIPRDQNDVPAIYAFCASSDYKGKVRGLDSALKVRSTLIKVPFDLEYWTKIAEERYPNGLPKPFSDDPTQWIFHGHPCGSIVWDEEKKWTVHGPLRSDDTVLQVAVARLLGYRWPAEQDSSMELADEARDWVKESEQLLRFADEDGIVCIPPVRGEASAADRLLNLLAAAYDDNWTGSTLSELLAKADHAGKSLETWLRDKFFLQHCRLFHHRPFIWHIWDGLRDGFSALVNYHKLDRKNLEALIYNYLGDWIRAQKEAVSRGIDGADERLAAAENLKKRLELILQGDEPYDIFVRWKPIEKQPIGWEPDLNDGVRLNIRPFMTAQVLRFNKKPQINITWEKDRGKDVESAPWYHMFKGDRINDHHLSLKEKLTAREGKGGQPC